MPSTNGKSGYYRSPNANLSAIALATAERQTPLSRHRIVRCESLHLCANPGKRCRIIF
jgi:hypothetical protein